MLRLNPRILPIFVLILNSCATASPAAPSATIDPCFPEAISETVKPINNLMREFDDASALSSNLPIEQLPEAISNLQRIRRLAQDINPPACLTALHGYELAHMNAVIDTLLAFLNGADTSTLNQGLNLAREQHDLYSVELARVLGLTLVPATASP
ncbi:MAG TPA: hypothetical protein PLA27_00765 [Anaerolineales bacterium]|jgi:hypothetical protein|nr:hypothetical protein [Anaerolineales bacterium]